MKYFYAEKDGRCYRFTTKQARTDAISDNGFKAITAPEALKMFGYTDSASRRVIKAFDYRKLPETNFDRILSEKSICEYTNISVTVSIGSLACYALSPTMVPEDDFEAVVRFIKNVHSMESQEAGG